MKKILFSILICFAVLPKTFNQQDTDLREVFLAAESYFLFEEFNEALPLYLKIHRAYPDNDNINFKIGVCFLSNPYEKDKSIPYLEQAIENINLKFKENSFKETAAPLESIFYLATAYRVNNKLDKAREYYNLFLDRIDPEIYDAEMVKEQLDACDAAEKLMKQPVDYDVESLSNKINTRFADMNPVISGDETKLAYVSKLQFYDAVFFTEKVNGEWNPPRNIIPELGVDGDVYPTCMSYNGTEMYVYRNDDYIGNLYVTRYVNGKWTPLVKLGDNINTKYWESHASVSKDGKTLYFSSNRKGGYGGLDIYMSKRLPDGNWGPAINLGGNINTRYNDDTPFITEDEKKIYFSSYGHYSMGGYDIFMSKRISDTVWAKPLNLGYPINTTDDDQFFNPLHNGAVGYYSKYTNEGFGRHDIYRYVVYDTDNPRLFNIKGLIDFMGEKSDPDEVNIMVISKNGKDTLAMTNPDSDGNYQFNIPAGSYDVVFESDKFLPETFDLEVPKNTPHEGFTIKDVVALEPKPIIIPSKDISDYLTIRSDSLIYVDSNKPVQIKYNAEPGTVSEISVTNDNITIYSDADLISKKRQSFEFTPETGENLVTITLTDSEGNKTSKTVKVILEPKQDVIQKDIKDTEDQTSEQKDFVNPADNLLKELIPLASDELKLYLEDLDVTELNLNTEKDLIDNLYKSVDDHEFTKEDVDEVLIKSGRLSDMDLLLRKLSEFTDNEYLKKFILKTDPEKENLKNIEDVFEYLYQKADDNAYTEKDVDLLKQKYYQSLEAEKLISDFSKYADGKLLEYLENLDPQAENIRNIEDLISHLIENADENGYSIEDVHKALEGYNKALKSKETENLLQKLLKDPVFKDLLSELSEDELAGMSESDIIKYLFDKAKEKGISDEEIIRRLLNIIKPDPQKTIEGVQQTSAPNLKDELKNYKEVPETALILFDNILMLADEKSGFDRQDVIVGFKKYLENRSLIDFLNTLKNHAEGDLLKALNELDLEKENIHSRQDLIDYLLKLSETRDFTIEDILRAVAGADKDLYFSTVLDRLISLAEGSLKQALLDLKHNNPGIDNIDDLVTYLLDKCSDYGYTEKDVFDLISRFYEEEKVESEYIDIISDSNQKSGFSKSLLKSVIVMSGLGIIIIILILITYRKRKSKKE